MKTLRGICAVAGVLLCCFMLHGCAPLYVPNVPPSPLFKGSGDIHLAAGTGPNGIDGNVAVAINDHVAVAAAGSFKSREDDTLVYSNHVYGEVMTGIYHPFDDISFNGSAALFVGVGVGSAEAGCFSSSELTCDNSQSSGAYYRLFVQGTFGISQDGILGWGKYGSSEEGLTIRGVYVSFPRINRSSDPSPASTATTSIQASAFFFEPVLFFKKSFLTSRSIQCGGQVQASSSILLGKEPPFQWSLLRLSFGVYLQLRNLGI